MPDCMRLYASKRLLLQNCVARTESVSADSLTMVLCPGNLVVSIGKGEDVAALFSCVPLLLVAHRVYSELRGADGYRSSNRPLEFIGKGTYLPVSARYVASVLVQS